MTYVDYKVLMGVFRFITGSTGRGRIYDGYPDLALDMINSRTFDGRIQLLEYVPTILFQPPTRLAACGTMCTTEAILEEAHGRPVRS